MIINRIDTGIYAAMHEGRQVGCISADQPAGGIAQGGPRHYSARFLPSPQSPGITYTGTLKACKLWLNQWGSML